MVRTIADLDPGLAAFARGLVQTPDKLNREAIHSLGWIAVPVASDEEIAATTVLRTAAAIRNLGVAECTALLLDKPSGQPQCLAFPASGEGLDAFHRARIVFRYLVTGRPASFAVLYSQEFYAVAGPASFVAEALGTLPEIAWARFDQYVEKWRTYNARGHAYFADIAQHYRAIAQG